MSNHYYDAHAFKAQVSTMTNWELVTQLEAVNRLQAKDIRNDDPEGKVAYMYLDKRSHLGCEIMDRMNAK